MITLSGAVHANLLSLQQTADLLGQTRERMATRKKVNSALDNPTAFFTASRLSSRASDLNRLQDFVSNAVQTLKAADETLASLSTLVETVEATIHKVIESPATVASVVSTIENLNPEDRIKSAYGLEDSDYIAVGDGIEHTLFRVSHTNTIQDLLDTINFNSDNTDLRATLTEEGALKLEAMGDSEIQADVFDFSGDADTLANMGFTHVTGQTIAYAGAVNSERVSYAQQFDSIRTQIDNLANDAGFNGVNLLLGDSLNVTFNEDGSSSLTVSGGVFNTTGLNIAASVNNFQTEYDLKDVLTAISDAKSALRSQASKFGSQHSVVQTRQKFSAALVSVLETGAANLTLADIDEEGANLLALRTRQQFSSTALALAAQADQNVLRLF